MPLINNLPSLLLPQRLAAVTSLEIMLEIPTGSTDDAITSLLGIIPSNFPKLRKLFVHLDGDIYPRTDDGENVPEGDIRRRAEVSEATLLAHFDHMLNSYGFRFIDCELGLPPSVFEPIANVARRRGDPCDEFRSWVYGAWWRGIHQGPPERGYWLVMGRDNSPVPCCKN